jgi:hypothetical protein
MSRLIDPVPRGGSLFAGNTKTAKTQTYLERVAKYVPAEIIAAYLTLLPIVLSGTTADTTSRKVWLAVIFAIGTIFTPLYLWRFPGDLKVKWYHLVISTLAFVVWTYSIRGGLFDDVGLYSTVGAAVSLVVFTLTSGLFAPTASTA